MKEFIKKLNKIQGKTFENFDEIAEYLEACFDEQEGDNLYGYFDDGEYAGEFAVYCKQNNGKILVDYTYYDFVK